MKAQWTAKFTLLNRHMWHEDKLAYRDISKHFTHFCTIFHIKLAVDNFDSRHNLYIS